MIEPVMGTVMAITFGMIVHDKALAKLGLINLFIVLLICIIIGFLYGLVFFVWSREWDPPPNGIWPTEEMEVRGTFRYVRGWGKEPKLSYSDFDFSGRWSTGFSKLWPLAGRWQSRYWMMLSVLWSVLLWPQHSCHRTSIPVCCGLTLVTLSGEVWIRTQSTTMPQEPSCPWNRPGFPRKSTSLIITTTWDTKAWPLVECRCCWPTLMSSEWYLSPP